MKALSTSFTLGKASLGQANIRHNNREIIANNVDVNRIYDNITFIKEDVEDIYIDLFGDALKEYNEKQKQPCRRIDNYYEHIENSKREESYYELVVQFGDVKSAAVGSHNGEIATKMLDEYMKDFEKRNPNLKIFNSVIHLDEASPHLHINVIPFYTKDRKKGLSKGVSMKSALIEQGFIPKSVKQNQLVMWETQELKIMESILNRYGFERDIKNANYAHQTVEDYKSSQDSKRLREHFQPGVALGEVTQENIDKLLIENSLLEIEKEKLTAQKQSPWKSFYYSVPEKQSYVQARLDELGVPYRETENGIEAQECYVNEIRKVEKEFKQANNPHREELRNLLDKFVMQSKNFEEVLQRLEDADYRIKHGKYISVLPKYASQYIRLKSLGENYSEQALQNRFISNQKFESDISDKIAVTKNHDTLEAMTYKTIRHYTFVFAKNLLPMKKVNNRKPFSWTNCHELDQLSELNKKINTGATLESLRSDFAEIEKSVSETEKKLAQSKKDLKIFTDLYDYAVKHFEQGCRIPAETEYLAKYKITAENYKRLLLVIDDENIAIAQLSESLSAERTKLQAASESLTLAEKVMGGTLVQSLIDEEKQRRQSDIIPNGLKTADGSDSKRIEEIAEKVVKSHEENQRKAFTRK